MVLRLLRGIQRAEAVIISSSILGIAALSSANVLARTAFGASLAWADELAQFLTIAVTFVGLSYAAGRGRHVRMTALYDQMPVRVRKLVMIGITISTALLLAVLAVSAAGYAATVRALGTVSPALRIPLWLVYATAPLGLGLGALQYALAGWRNLVDEELYIAFDVPEAREDPVQTSL